MNIWKVLGIEFTNNKREIKKAYAKLTKKYHPETHPEEFIKINEAYKIALLLAEQGEISFENSMPIEKEAEEYADLFEDIIIHNDIGTVLDNDTTLIVEGRREYEKRVSQIFIILDKEIQEDCSTNPQILTDITESVVFKSIYRKEDFISRLIDFLEHRDPAIDVWQHFYDIYKPLIQDNYQYYKSKWYPKMMRGVKNEWLICQEHKLVLMKLIKNFSLACLINIIILFFASAKVSSESNNWILVLFPVLCIVPNVLFSTRYKVSNMYSIPLKIIWIVYLTVIPSPILFLEVYEYVLADTTLRVLRVLSLPVIAMECVYFFNYFDYWFSDIYLETKLSYLKRRTFLLAMIILSITLQYVPFSDEDMMIVLMKFLWIPITAIILFHILKFTSIIIAKNLRKFLVYSIWEVKDKMIANAFYLFLYIKHIILLRDYELVNNRIGLSYYVGMLLVDIAISIIIYKKYRPLNIKKILL